MKSGLYLAFILVLSLLISGCGPKKVENFQSMEVGFDFKSGSGPRPEPEITIKNVPSGTAWLEVRMSDLDLLSYDHGGGIVAYDGKGFIPVGSLQRYRGPNPPAGTRHRYVIVVKALNNDKSLLLGEGESMRLYP